MTNIPLKRIRRIYKILLCVSIVAAGICLITGCLYIYFTGEGYSRQIITNTFAKINIPIYLCLIFVIGDIVWELIDSTEPKPKTIKQKTEISNGTPATSNKKIIITRLVILLTAIAILILGFFAGGYADVLTKAVNICTECIGLG